MSLKMENPAGGRGVPVTVQADGSNNPEYALDQLRAQYLSIVFDLPASTALTVAELAFGSEVRA